MHIFDILRSIPLYSPNGRGANAGILAAKILAVADKELLGRLKEYSLSLKEGVLAKDATRTHTRQMGCHPRPCNNHLKPFFLRCLRIFKKNIRLPVGRNNSHFIRNPQFVQKHFLVN